MNDDIRKAAAEVKRLRESIEEKKASLQKGFYSHRLYIERDLFELQNAEFNLVNKVLAALEDEKTA